MLAAARLNASLLSSLGPARRWLVVLASHGKPRIGDCKTVSEVLRVHELHALAFSPMDVGTCWNVLGKLVRREHTQRDWLRKELSQKPALQLLLDTTLERLPSFKAKPLCNTAHGLAAVTAATGFVPGEKGAFSHNMRALNKSYLGSPRRSGTKVIYKTGIHTRRTGGGDMTLSPSRIRLGAALG